jgi:hypothetical protein
MPDLNTMPETKPKLVPPEYLAIFGPPALLRNEDPARYYALMDALVTEKQPKGMSDWLWVKGACDNTWHSWRLRRFADLELEHRRKRYHEIRLSREPVRQRCASCTQPCEFCDGESGDCTKSCKAPCEQCPQEYPDAPVEAWIDEEESATLYMATIMETRPIYAQIAGSERGRDRNLWELDRRRGAFSRNGKLKLATPPAAPENPSGNPAGMHGAAESAANAWASPSAARENAAEGGASPPAVPASAADVSKSTSAETESISLTSALEGVAANREGTWSGGENVSCGQASAIAVRNDASGPRAGPTTATEVVLTALANPKVTLGDIVDAAERAGVLQEHASALQEALPENTEEKKAA